MAIGAEEILNNLKNNEYAPVYFLQGEEPFFIDQIVSYIEKNALPEEAKSFNQQVMYGKDVSINDILLAARRFPMMSERQVVIIKEAQDINDLKKETPQKLMMDYLSNPTLSTILVFSHKYKKLDGRSALYKSFNSNSTLFTSKKFYDNQIPQWIIKYVSSLGLGISPHVAQLIVDHNGNDLEKITNEIGKIIEAIPGVSEISENAVYKYIGINREYNNFELVNAILLKDTIKANRIVNYYEKNPKKNPIIPVLALVFNAFKKLLIMHQYSGESDKVLAGKVGVNPYFLKEYKIAMGNYPIQKVIANIQFIHEADLASKGIDSPSISGGQLLRELIFKILH